MVFAFLADPGTSLGGKNTSADRDAQAACSCHASSASKYSSPTMEIIVSLHRSACAIQTSVVARMFPIAPAGALTALGRGTGSDVVERPYEVALAPDDPFDPAYEFLQQSGVGPIRNLPGELDHALGNVDRHIA